MNASLTFADLALESSLEHNRSLKLMQKIDSAINWSRVERILFSHYAVGTSGEGADAYPPLLFKCMRFRSRLSKNAMDEINSEILRHFKTKGLTIDEGIAVDARLVKSTSRPVSNENSKKSKKNTLPLKAALIKMASRKSLPGTWTLTGLPKKTSNTMASKNIPP